MKADAPLLSEAAARRALDVLLDSDSLAETVASVLPARLGPDAYFHRRAVDLLHALAHAAALANDAVTAVARVDSWLRDDYTEPITALTQEGAGHLVSQLEALHNTPDAERAAVVFTAQDALNRLTRVVAAQS